MLKQYIYIPLIALFLAIAHAQMACASDKHKILVETSKVKMQKLYEIYKTVGRIENVNSKNFFAKAEGTIDNITDKAGDFVKKGDFVLSINYNLAETIKSEAELRFKIAKSNFEKDLKLFNKHIIPEDSLHKSKLDFENSKLSLEKALDTYESMVITAPFDGQLGIIQHKIDSNIKVGDFLFTIVSAGFKEAVITLPQKLYRYVDKNSEVYFIDDYQKRYKARITSISPYISKETGNFDIKLELSEANNLIHGSFVDVEVRYNVHEALVAPEQAILKDEKGNFLYLLREGKAIKNYVNLGTRYLNMIEIKDTDIQEGSEIVTEGLTKVFSEAEVSVKEESHNKD